LVVGVGLTKGRDEARTVVATTGWRTAIPPAWVFVLIVLAGPGSHVTAKAQEPTGQFTSPPPQPGISWFSRRGLDVGHNKLDAIISAGLPCPQYRRIWPGECPTEDFLTRFLKSLPPDLSVIDDTLRSFGAVCRKFSQRLTCEYRKQENYKEKLTNNRFNEEVHYYAAKIEVAERNATLTYSVNFDRKVKTLYKNKPPEREVGALGRDQPRSSAIHRKND